MPEDLQHIRAFIRALVRRERRLMAGVAGARALVVCACGVWLTVVALWGHWDRIATAMAVVVVLGTLMGAWVLWPLVRGWGPSGDPMRHARRVEALDPELRGRLLTSVEHRNGPLGNESEALFALVVRRAMRAVAMAPSQVVSSQPMRRAVWLGVAAWVLLLPALVMSPGGAGAVWRFWLGGMNAQAAVATPTVGVEAELARVGDLVIRYVYPAYTGLDPRVERNTIGDVQGPPGTVVEVKARSADPVEAAGLVAYGSTFDADLAEDGRSLTADFRIGSNEGEWHLVLYQQGEAERSRSFQILPEADLPPEVVLEGVPDRIEVALDQVFALPWRARDDFGVARVDLVGDLQQTLFEADERRAEVWDRLVGTPMSLGLEPGDVARIAVMAWDNDTHQGSKSGQSRSVEIVVLGAEGLQEQRLGRHDELIELMVPVLARNLTDPWPPGSSQRDIVRWGEKVARRYEPLQSGVEAMWRGLSRSGLDRAVVDRVLRAGRDLIRYTQVAFSPSAERRPPSAEMQRLEVLREDATVALEQALLTFMAEAEMAAIRELSEVSGVLDEVATRIGEELDSGQMDGMAMTARLEQTERFFEQIEASTQAMREGGLRSYVEQRTSEMKGLRSEVRRALEEGRSDDAERLMRRFVQQMGDLAQGIRDEFERRQAQREESEGNAREVVEKLKQIEAEQRQVQAQVQALREGQDQASAERTNELWQQIAQLATETRGLGQEYADALKPAKRPFYEQDRAATAVEALEDIQNAVRVRDVVGARAGTMEANHQWMVVVRTAQGLFDQTRSNALKGPTLEQTQGILTRLRRIEALLDQLQQESSQLDEAGRREANALRAQQRNLQNELIQTMEEAEAVAQELPVSPEGMEERLDEANERMGQAEEDLGRGRTMAAEGSQGVASGRVREARRILEQAIQRSQAQGGQGQGQGEQGESGGSDGEEEDGGGEREDNGEGQDFSSTDLYVPGREAFESPEAYRKALIEGMQGDVPEEYRAWKKRYYEELVRQ